jgi:membrane protease YdiL (CAAX protease family)
MASNQISLGSLIRILLIIITAEALALMGISISNLPYLVILGGIRLMQIAGILWVVIHWERDLAAIGWAPGTWLHGLKQGALWSLGFALATAAAMGIVIVMGQNPLQWLRFPLPSNPRDLVIFFLVGGLIAPVAEEICFRGVIYTFMRELGTKIGALVSHQAKSPHTKRLKAFAILFALITSTFLFTILHSFHGIPVTQIVGGLVFAIAYETSGNLTVPMVIHTLGNLALFSISL